MKEDLKVNNELIIKSKDNKKFKSLMQVKANKKNDEHLILVEGEDLIDMALESNFEVKEVVSLEYNEKYSSYPQTLLSKELYRELSSYLSLPRSIGLVTFNFKENYGDKIIYLDGVQDPGNLGTIIRTALAFGYKDICLSKNCVSPLNNKVIQSTKGALFKVNLYYEKLESFVSKGYTLYETCLDGEDINKIEKVKSKFVLVFGNEGQGISKSNLSLPSKHVLLPISREIDSLNVGVAAGIFMYLWSN